MKLTKNDKEWLRALADQYAQGLPVSRKLGPSIIGDGHEIRMTRDRLHSLVDAGYVERRARGNYVITDAGRAAAADPNPKPKATTPAPEPPKASEFVAPTVTFPFEVSMYEPKDKVFLTRMHGGHGKYGDTEFDFCTDWSGGCFIIDVKRSGRTIRSYTLNVSQLAKQAVTHCDENPPISTDEE